MRTHTKKYQSINNLEGVGGTDKEQENVALAVAPHSLLEGTSLPVFGAQAFEYKPEMVELPTFVMPKSLPLGRLADIHYGGGENQNSIAPSVAFFPSLPTLAALPAPAKVYQAAPTNIPDMIPEAPMAPAPAASSSAPPGPPGPPRPTAAPAPPSAPVPPGPPGPPKPPPGPPGGPPGPPAAPSAPAPPSTAPPPPKSSASANGGGRGDLLSAIRAKKELKKVAETEKKDRSDGVGGGGGEGGGGGDDKTEKKAGGGGGGPMDMMSALKNRLSNIRAVTSGKDKAGGAAPAKEAPKLAPPKEDDHDDWDT